MIREGLCCRVDADRPQVRLPKHLERGERKPPLPLSRHHQWQLRAGLPPAFLSPYADGEVVNRLVLYTDFRTRRVDPGIWHLVVRMDWGSGVLGLVDLFRGGCGGDGRVG